MNPAQPIRQTRSAQIMYHIGAVLQRSILLFPLGFVAMCAAAAVNLLTGSIGPCGENGAYLSRRALRRESDLRRQRLRRSWNLVLG